MLDSTDVCAPHIVAGAKSIDHPSYTGLFPCARSGGGCGFFGGIMSTERDAPSRGVGRGVDPRDVATTCPEGQV